MARPNEAVVCLPNGTWAPSVICKPMQRHPTFTLPARIRWQREREGKRDHVRPYPECVSLFACCENPATALRWDLLHSARWAFVARRKHATASVPQFPNVAWTGSVTYVCVVRNVGWVCVVVARQLELGWAASLMGALHGSCVYYTAMAWRLIWQQLTLDLSSPLLSSQAQKDTYTHTHIQ